MLLAIWLDSGAAQEVAFDVEVMFDFGDGVVLWQGVDLGENRTAIRATEVAAASLDLNVEVVWSEFGAFVADIGDRNPALPEYFHLLIWDGNSSTWELSPLGASSLILVAGDIFAWFLSTDNPWDFESPWPGPRPLSTPLHPFPTVTFRGDRANRGATSAAPPGRSPVERWRFDTGGAEIGASPVAAGGVIYQVTWNGTHAVNLMSGESLWKASEVAGLSTPALVEGGLIAGSRDGRLYRLDTEDGRVAWSVRLLEGSLFTGIASSPKVSGGRALVGTFNESGGNGSLVAVSVADGVLLWSVQTGSIHMSSPAVHDGVVYTGLMGLFRGASLTWGPPHGLLSVFEENGTKRWFYATDGPVTSSPAVHEGVVYFTSRDGYLHAVSSERIPLFRRAIGPSTSSPAVGDGMVFAASGLLGTEGKVAAYTLAGELVWEFTPNGAVQSSLTLASGHLLFATNTDVGAVYALEAASGEVVWTYIPEPHQYILPTPAVIDGLVVIASDNGFVYVLGPAETPALAAGALAATIVLVVGIVVAVAVFFYPRRYRAP